METVRPLAITLKQHVCSQLSQWAKEQRLLPSSAESLTDEGLASVVSHFIQWALAQEVSSTDNQLGKAQA